VLEWFTSLAGSCKSRAGLLLLFINGILQIFFNRSHILLE